MDAIQSARALGKAIQQDERYLRMINAQKKSDADSELQAMIEKFNGMRDTLNAELMKPDKDNDRVKEIDAELKELYHNIFSSESMQEFSAAREEMQNMMTFINQIIAGSAGGEDPDSIEFEQGCSGSCGGCSGCH